MKIHSTAIVDKKAQLAENVEIGPFCTVGPDVKIGKDTVLTSHVVVDGITSIGERCRIFPGTTIGLEAQHLKAKNKKGLVVMGHDNVLRECVTVHAGSEDGAKTVIGDRNFLMNYCHVGHDCQLQNGIVMANATQLGGHVYVEDNVVIGGILGVHQFSRIGRFAMVGGMSKVNTDIPPYSLCDGNPVRFRGANLVGLKRAGFDSARIQKIKKALKIFLASGLNRSNALEEVRKEFTGDKDIAHLLDFVEKSKRPLVRFESVPVEEEVS